MADDRQPTKENMPPIKQLTATSTSRPMTVFEMLVVPVLAVLIAFTAKMTATPTPAIRKSQPNTLSVPEITDGESMGIPPLGDGISCYLVMPAAHFGAGST
jgi:hypothetical protein